MKRILIVDDHEENLYLLRVTLQSYGFAIEEAKNGLQALEMARARHPDMVVSDLLMPVMDGYNLLRHWKADSSLNSIPFMVYTSTYPQAKDEQLAMDMGADAFFIKPTEPEILVAQMRTILDAAEAPGRVVRTPVVTEPESLRIYNEVLISKLEKRGDELERRVGELNRAQERVLRLNRLYAALSETSQAIVHAADRDELFQELCRISVERGGVASANVGWMDPHSGEVRAVAISGTEPIWLARLAPIGLSATPRTPIELVLAKRALFLSNDLQSEPELAPVVDDMKQLNFLSGACFPLHSGERLVGTLSLYAAQKDFFDQELIELLTEMVADVCFALSHFEKDAERQRVQEQLRASEEASRLNSRAVEASANGIVICDAVTSEVTITYVNPAFERITGYSADESRGRGIRFLMGNDTKQFGVSEISAAVRERREGNAMLRNYRKDGTLFWNDLSIAPVRNTAGDVTHFVGILNDITERKQYEEQLERQNNQDALTGLASRHLIKERADLAIAFAARQNRSVALMFLDLDHFKRINDSMGHTLGDAILVEVARRLSLNMRERDTLARIGGDEFAAVLSDLAGPQEVPLLVDKVLQEIALPIPLQDFEISLSASIGVSLYPQDGDDYEALLRNADAAMYRAKEAGRNTFRFYTSDMNAQALRKLELEARLRYATARDELLLHYQPLMNLVTNKVTDVEVLLRWRNADGSLMLPHDFIPLAEETGLIVSIGEWVLRTACAQARAWYDSGVELRVAVNLSARQFRDVRLVQMVCSALEESRLPASLLKLEITESAVMEDGEQARNILSELKALGIGISVDDFGTGYSSLAYLQRFPIDQLKIDRSFVKDMTLHAGSASIVHSIIALARNLRLQTVGEGVETPQQRDFLRGAGCDLMQGYLFSMPLPPQELIDFVRAHQGEKQTRRSGA